MIIDDSAIEFFDSIPDELLLKIAVNDWVALQNMCMALTLDNQILKETSEKYLKRGLDI